MPPVNNTPILTTKTSMASQLSASPSLDTSSNPEISFSTTAYTQNKHDNPMPFASTDISLFARETKQHCNFEAKYKDLLECLAKGKNSEVNSLLVNHVREVDKLVQSHKVSFASAHQQFILSLSNNIPEDLQDKDLDICIDNINTLLNKILFFTQKLVEIRSSNKNKAKQYVNTATVIQPIWLFKTKTIINTKSLLDLSEEQIIQLANEPNIDKLISKKFIGKGFSVILPTITGKNSNSFNVTRKRDSSVLDTPYHYTADKRIKQNTTQSNKIKLGIENKLLLNEYVEKIEKFCQNKDINFSPSFKNLINYLYNHECSSLFDNQGNYLLSNILDKLFLLVTESNKYNTLTSLWCFTNHIFTTSLINVSSILDIPDELIKDRCFNQSLFKLLKMPRQRGRGYPTVADILAAQTST